MKSFGRLLTACSLALLISACAGFLSHHDIADVQRNAGHYADHTVTIDGTVTNSWGVPMVPFRFYQVQDGTGEMTVLSRSTSRIPVRGSRVSVRGVVRDVAVLGGQPLGLHLEEQSLNIKRD